MDRDGQLQTRQVCFYHDLVMHTVVICLILYASFAFTPISRLPRLLLDVVFVLLH